MADLTGSSQPVMLGNNYRLRAPGVFGRANLAPRRSIAGATRSTTAAAEREPLDRALAAQEMQDVATVDVTITRRQPAPAGPVLRAPNGDDAMELEVPAPPPGHDAIVIAVDEAGAISWNFPLNETGTLAPATTRGPGQSLRFRIPNKPAVTPPPGTAATRSLFGTIGKKILKVLIYPVTDRLIGPLVEHFAEKWEGKNRPYRLRLMTPDNYGSDATPIALDGTEFKDLEKGRSLLFIHGTFSTAHSAFAGLTRDDVAALSQAYGGRLYAFDHFTLSHSPERNVAEFVSRIPASTRFQSDIVCHSRGGLVARELVERKTANGLDNRLDVGKVVFVGAANAGTVLTEPDHMVHMIDRYTTAINLLPDGPATWLLESVITAIKVVGHGGLKSLDGLASMNPKGAYLSGLSAGSMGHARYFGITADFEPAGTPFSGLALRDAVMDRIFDSSENDLVVPTAGVYEGGGPCFPIVTGDLLSLPASAGVVHTSYFANKEVQNQLRQWLTG